jgi:ketosteroid isomerase-like protein
MPRQIAVLLLLIVSCGFARSSPAEATRPIPSWAANFLRSWYASFNQGDAAGIASLFSEGARLGDLQGRTAILKSLEAQFEKTQYQCTGAYDGLKTLGNLTVAWGHESCLSTSLVDGRKDQWNERWLLVFEKTTPDQWLLTRETYERLR